MAIGLVNFEAKAVHPLDLIEQSVEARDWASERTENDKLVAEVEGRWCHYTMLFEWSRQIDALNMTCTFDTRTPEPRRQAVYELVARANDRLWIGHFDVSGEQLMPSFRHGVLLRGSPFSPEQIEDLVDIALTEMERFYPAFQQVIWGERSPVDALAVSIFDTAGEA